MLVGWLLGRRTRGLEWPQTCQVLAKIGPLRADRWDDGDHESFLEKMLDQFHAQVSEESVERVTRLTGGH
jgi:hypothetical protein